MKFRLASDIHTEFLDLEDMTRLASEALPPLDDDKKTTLLLAGDIGAAGKMENIVEFITHLAPRFKQILYTPGNHEYYHGNLAITHKEIEALLAHHENVLFSRASSQLMGGQIVHMHTLWTDYDKENPLSMVEAHVRMNDYRFIGCNDHIANPADMLIRHQYHLEQLKEDMTAGDIVMTHHSPSLKSIPPEYLADRVNGAYHSDLEWLMLEKKPAVWVHGHTHTACDYMVGSTRVICNPRGYGNQFKKNGYNATLTFEV